MTQKVARLGVITYNKSLLEMDSTYCSESFVLFLSILYFHYLPDTKSRGECPGCQIHLIGIAIRVEILHLVRAVMTVVPKDGSKPLSPNPKAPPQSAFESR